VVAGWSAGEAGDGAPRCGCAQRRSAASEWRCCWVARVRTPSRPAESRAPRRPAGAEVPCSGSAGRSPGRSSAGPWTESSTAAAADRNRRWHRCWRGANWAGSTMAGGCGDGTVSASGGSATDAVRCVPAVRRQRWVAVRASGDALGKTAT